MQRSAQEWSKVLSSWGWCILPVPHGGKFPTMPWKAFQEDLPTEGQLEQWFASDVGLCALCGSISDGLGVLDFDVREAYESWCDAFPVLSEELPTAKTGRGYHVFFRIRPEEPNPSVFVPSMAIQGPWFDGRAGDLLGDGKLVVLPPTIHPSGTERTWVREPTAQLPEFALEELGLLVVKADSAMNGARLVSEPIAEGSRHQNLLKLGAKLRAQGSRYGFILDVLSAVNDARCKPPLAPSEVADVAEWCAKQSERPSLMKGLRDDDEGVTPSVTHSYSLRDDETAAEVEQKFEALFRACPEYLQVANVAEPKWVVEGLLPESYLVVLGGNSKSGKTCLVTNMAMSVSTGEPFLGLPTTASSVLWCAFEESEYERALNLQRYPSAPESLYITHEKLHIDQPEGLEAIRWWVRKTGAKLVVIDPLYSASTAESLSDGRKARESLSGLKDLCRTESTSCILIHHITKNVGAGMIRERMADSNQIVATASMDILLDVSEQGDGSRELKMIAKGRGDFANQTWVIHSNGVTDYELVRHGSTVQMDTQFQDAAICQALTVSDQFGMTAEEISAPSGLNVKSVRNRLTDLLKAGKVVPVGKKDRAKAYVLAGSDAEYMAASA